MATLSILSKFLEWCKYVKIVSKEKGVMPFSPQYWFQSQKIVVKEVAGEILRNSEKREFLILKARQLGVTAILNALDIFWVMANKGIKLCFLCHSYEARPKLRETLRTIYLSLPRNIKIPVLMDNREMMHFANGSEIHFLHVSSRESSRQTVARSQSATCLHATEAAFYDVNDPNNEVLKSLLISMSKTHPARWTILESTANGFNSFYDRWVEAKKNPSQKNIFIGWYYRDDYRISKTNPLYQEYSYPLTREEKMRVKLVKELYNFDIDMEQIAWYRKELATTFNNDINYALQELPWVEEEAFRLSGSCFFNLMTLTDIRKKVEKIKPLYLNVIADTKGVLVTKGNRTDHNTKIFEMPNFKNTYIIGVDPSYASNPNSDNGVISVWKAYKDKIIQVAEFSDNSFGVVEFAKICMFFACFYPNSYINIEVQGPGRAVLHEFQQMKRGLYDLGEITWHGLDDIDLANIKRNMKRIGEYYYSRADSVNLTPSARHWQTTPSTKEPLCATFKSFVELNAVEIKSIDLVEEMKRFVRNGSTLGAEIGHDDRVIAAAIAIEFWRKNLYSKLPEYKEENENEEVIVTPESKKMNEIFLKTVGIYDKLNYFTQR